MEKSMKLLAITLSLIVLSTMQLVHSYAISKIIIRDNTYKFYEVDGMKIKAKKIVINFDAANNDVIQDEYKISKEIRIYDVLKAR